MKKLLFIFGVSLLILACGEVPENNTYKVIYHDNGSTSGYPPVDNNKYVSGSYATVLGQNTLLKTEYEFGGWNTEPDYSGTHYDSGDQIEIKNITIFLHAVWNEP